MGNDPIDVEVLENNTDIAVLNNLDTIVDVANRAEKYVEAVNKIKKMVINITNVRDWIDEQGKPYLQVSGAEKIATLFRIGWDFPEDPKLETLDDGHFMYTVKGIFRMGPVKIEAYGTRSSSDAFFSRAKGEDIPATEIDRATVKKAAVTNCIGNGITRILGIRNLTWEELDKTKISAGNTTKVERKTLDDQGKAELQALTEMLMEMAFDDKDKCADLLEKYTTFKTKKDGVEKIVNGVRSFKKLSAKQLPVTYGKVKKDYDVFIAEMQGDASESWDEEPTEEDMV